MTRVLHSVLSSAIVCALVTLTGGRLYSQAPASPVAQARLKPIESVVEDVPALQAADLEMFAFCAAYYQRPLGEVVAATLPPRLRQVTRRKLAAMPPVGPRRRR